MAKLAKESCPTCGCEIREGFYAIDKIKYCCEPCAKGNPCECECCKLVIDVPKKSKAKAKK